MLKAGDVVDAEVINVQVFGIFCRHRDEELFVLIPETSWLASSCSCQGFAQPGDSLTVKILNVDIESGKIAATIKGRHPNPWETKQLNVGSTHEARVVRHVTASEYDQEGYLIELMPGAYTMFSDTKRHLAPNDLVPVVIQSCNPQRQAVEVAITNSS
jgi:ribosomal protein S1